MTLSIVVPARNEEKNIEWMLRQLHDNLTEVNHEIILSDDRSTDRTREIAARYATVIIHPEPEHPTIAANRNFGGGKARGEFIAFIDSDIFVPNPNVFFKKLLADFAANKKVNGITVRIEIFPEQASAADKIILWVINRARWIDNNFWHHGSASGEFQMVRRDVFEKLHGYNETLPIAEDNEFFARIAKSGRTFFEKDLVVYTTDRRARQEGWQRLLWLWTINWLYMTFFNRSYSKEWPPKAKS